MTLLAVTLALLGSQFALYLALFAAGLEWLGRRPVRASEPFDAVVVLGCRLRDDGSAGPGLIRRAREGARLVREGRAPRLVLTGGATGPSPTSEARAALPHALAEGVAEQAVLLEERSRTTEENAAEVRALLGDPSLRVLIVTDAYHVPRSVRLFRKHFPKCAGHGVPGQGLSLVQNALREACITVLAIASGKLDG